MQTTVINEGMREGDLADLVLPLISVDEFESKVSKNESIVFGFYVRDEAAGNDMNRFLQKSAVPLLDTEVSPAPDQHGYFMVFVEMLHNDRLAQNLNDILSEMRTLVDIDEWEMRVRHHDGLVTFSERNLTRALERSHREAQTEAVLEFLQPSALDNAQIEDGFLVLQGSGERHVFEFVRLDRATHLLEQLNERPSLSMHAVARTNRITRMLGENWQAMILGPYMLLHTVSDSRALLLRV